MLKLNESLDFLLYLLLLAFFTNSFFQKGRITKLNVKIGNHNTHTVVCA